MPVWTESSSSTYVWWGVRFTVGTFTRRVDGYGEKNILGVAGVGAGGDGFTSVSARKCRYAGERRREGSIV